MIRKYYNHKLQTTQWHREEEPLNHHKTPGRQIKQSNQLSLPHQYDCNTRMDIPVLTQTRTQYRLIYFRRPHASYQTDTECVMTAPCCLQIEGDLMPSKNLISFIPIMYYIREEQITIQYNLINIVETANNDEKINAIRAFVVQ